MDLSQDRLRDDDDDDDNDIASVFTRTVLRDGRQHIV
jgi:hypothetical protein